MPFDPIDELLAQATRDGGQWPPKQHKPAWTTVRQWRAFLESDRAALARIAGWDARRTYKVDPLAERIAEAWADYLFGDDPTFIPGDEADAELLEDLVETNELGDELRAAERLCAGEGEVWWRISVDPELADAPLVEFHSRSAVMPLIIGRRVAAAALVTDLAKKPGDRTGIYRHLEIHAPGRVEHVLYRGTKQRIGDPVDLTQHPETETLDAVWAHDLPAMLMGRIVNKRGRTSLLGVSEYHGISDFLLELNEALVIGGENMRLTAKKRIVAPSTSSALAPAGTPGVGVGVDLIDRGDGILVPATSGATFDAGEDVFIIDPADTELGRADTPFRVLEYSYDAEALIAHKRDLVESAVTRVGLSAQAVGVGDQAGYAISGTAIRLKLIPTDKAGRGKARPWDKALPRMLALLAAVDALPMDRGGFDRGWRRDAAGDVVTPAIQRANPLPADPVEDAQVDQALIGVGARSRYTSIRRQHPDWSDVQVDEELDRIREEAPPAPALGGGF